MTTRPGADPRNTAYYRRRQQPIALLAGKRIAAARAEDLPILRAALAEERQIKAPHPELIKRLVTRISELDGRGAPAGNRNAAKPARERRVVLPAQRLAPDAAALLTPARIARHGGIGRVLDAALRLLARSE